MTLFDNRKKAMLPFGMLLQPNFYPKAIQHNY